MKNWDKILDDFARKCKGGAPDMTNPRHLALLRESLLKFGWKENATNEFLGNLRDGKEIVTEDWWSDLDPEGQAKYIKAHPKSKKAQEAEAEKDDEDGESKKKKKSKSKPDKKDKKEKPEKKSEPQKPSEEQQQEKDKINVAVKEDLDFILEHSEDVRTQGGAGSNTPSRQQIKDMHTFYEERAKQDARRKEAEEKGEPFDEEPYVHPDVVQREINDETLDKSIDYLKEELGPEEFEKLMRFISKGGAVSPALTKITKLKKGQPGYPGIDPDSPGYKRAREILRLYLKNDGKCVVTGVPMPLAQCEPDHRIPYGSAADEAKRNGTTKEEEQAKLDNIQGNMDLVIGPVNQFKGSLVEDKLLNEIRKELALSDEAVETRRLETEYTNARTAALNKHYREKFLNGDYTSLSERRIEEADYAERNAMMKSWNYLHPSKKEFKEQLEGKKSKGIEPDLDYYEKLKKSWKAQGVELPDNHDDIDWDNPPFNKWMNRYGFGGGKSRERSNRQSAVPERKYMIEHFTSQGQDVPTIEEEKERDEVVDEAREKIRNEMTLKQIEIEKVKLKDPDKSDAQKKNIKRKIDKLQKSLE